MANALLAKDPAETCVLVTGGAGFIGSHTVVELLERNYQVVIVDDLSNSSREAVRRVGEIAGVAPVFADLPNEEEAEAVAAVAGAAVREVAPGPSLTFYEANILDRDELETIFTMHAVDVIIHFAGFKAVGESVAKPLEYYWNNIAGTLVLCEVAREHGCKNIVFSSSATVYGEPEFVPITERSRSLPTCTRAITSGTSCCCATSTPSAPTNPVASARIRRASRTTCCPMWLRWP